MRFRIQQRFQAEPAAVCAAYTDPGLYPTMIGLTKVATPEVLERVADGARVTLRLRMRFVADLNAAARAVVDPTRITWVQEEHYDLTGLRAGVEFHPDHYADRFSCRGQIAFLPGDGPATCTRVLEGDLRIRVPLVGGQAERAMVMGLEEHAAEERPIVQRWLDEHPSPSHPAPS